MRGLYQVIIYDYKEEEVLADELVFAKGMEKACNEVADVILRKGHSIKDIKSTARCINEWEKEVKD